MEIATTPVFLPGKSQEQRSLASYRPWSRGELEMTQRLNNKKSMAHQSQSFIWENLCSCGRINNDPKDKHKLGPNLWTYKRITYMAKGLYRFY